jgi:hypothetical protein
MQPLVGLTGKKSPADEKLFEEINATNPNASGIAMMDARPWANAVANKGRKGGFENVSRYEDSDTTLLFLNIDNIHVMRDSVGQMYELIRSSETSGTVGPKSILKTGWPACVGRLRLPIFTVLCHLFFLIVSFISFFSFRFVSFLFFYFLFFSLLFFFISNVITVYRYVGRVMGSAATIIKEIEANKKVHHPCMLCTRVNVR